MKLVVEFAETVASHSTAWAAAVFAIVVWGVTFAATRSLLEEFSVLEILVLRFALAWGALWMWEMGRRILRRSRVSPERSEHCGAMSLEGCGRPTARSRGTRDLPRHQCLPVQDLVCVAVGALKSVASA